MGSVTRFICQILVYLIRVFLCFVSICILPAFSFVFTWVSRQQKNGGFLKNNAKEKSYLETEPEIETGENVTEFGDDDYYVEEEKSELFLKFRFPRLQEFSNLFNSEAAPDDNSTSKNDFTSRISFIKETEFLTPEESNGNGILDITEDEEDFFDINLEHISNETGDFHGENLVVKSESMELTEKCKENRQSVQEQEEFLSIQDFLGDEKYSAMDSETELTSDEFLSDGDFGGEQLKNQDKLNSDFLSHKDFNEEDSDKKYSSEYVTKNPSVKPKPKNLSMPDSGDANKLESLWEHQELIEQLKMELRKVRATGLPTILEESESPKIMDDLKPWKIDEKFQHEDCMDELHKFYKSYRERMRKFDILNYQKMYAIGFLQLKDPLQSISKPKPSAPTLKSLVSQNLWLFKHKIHGSDPMKKFINELQGDLESVYVGQVCLSWEFLHWQYDKALGLWNSDPRGIHQYNEIAGEFQQFQVLVQRFIEDEPFQGPRVQNYVKNRCVLRNLLQVPVIREDSMKNKNRGKKSKDHQTDESTVTSGILVEIVEESIRIFWRFIQADKDCNITAAINDRKIKNIAELHTPADQKLLVDVKKNLQKKERMVKDILRSENCILRKLRRRLQQEDDDDDNSDQVLYFFSQVDMKLICRVLNMSRISRDQLIWCDNKLNRISFVNRKIQVEPAALLLFPC